MRYLDEYRDSVPATTPPAEIDQVTIGSKRIVDLLVGEQPPRTC